MQIDQSCSVSPITHLYLVLKDNTGRGWGHVLADSLNPDPTAHLISLDLQSVCIRILKYSRTRKSVHRTRMPPPNAIQKMVYM